MASRQDISKSKITIHDQHRFEIKLDIDLPDRRRGSYRVETFLFVPKALNITPGTYSKERFYGSAQRYIRFRTPRMSIDTLLDEISPASPYGRIRRSLPSLKRQGEQSPPLESVYGELKLFGAIGKETLRRGLDKAHNEETCRHFLAQTELLLAKWINLKKELSDESIPRKIRDGALFLDEFLSLTVEEFLTSLLEKIRSDKTLHAQLGELDASIVALISSQQHYRILMNYPSVITPGSRNSTLLYRRGVLKKFVSGVLHLNLESSEWEGWMQLWLGIAAGVAMLFAVAITFFAQDRFATNSASFAAILVISYIFKDRLKDWLKIFFSKNMVRWIADRKIRIRDPYSGQIIGYFKEAFSFIEYSQVPAEILLRRNMDNITSIDEEGKPERVMKYDKQIVLFAGRIARSHERRRHINDIMRFNIDPFLVQTDDPLVPHSHLNPVTGTIEKLECERVYHVNLVFRYSTRRLGRRRARQRVDRVRLVLSRNGIISLEEVS